MKFNLKHGCKKEEEKYQYIHTQKYDSSRYFFLMLSFSFLIFFCNFHMKQEILEDNKIGNKKNKIKKG